MEEQLEIESQTLRNGQQMMKITLNNTSYQLPNNQLDEDSIYVTPKDSSFRYLYLRQHSEKILDVESQCLSNIANQSIVNKDANNQDMQMLTPINDKDSYIQASQNIIAKSNKEESKIQSTHQQSQDHSHMQNVTNGKSVICQINSNSNSKLEEDETFQQQSQSQQLEKQQKVIDISQEAQSNVGTFYKTQQKKQKTTHNLINSLQLAKRFIAKLKQVSSKVLFKNLSYRQFGIINDVAANYKFYVEKKDIQQIFEIYSNGVTIKDRYTIFKKNNWKIIEIPSKLSELEIKFQISDSFKNWLKLLKLELSVLILAHVACCIFLLIGQFERDNNKDNWIDKYNYSNYTVIELYLTSFYFIIISICTVGYGDIAPCTIIEREFIILVALISTNITAYSFSQISEIVKFEDSKKESFNKVMVGINFQMKLNSLGMNLQQKVRKYFEYLHDSDLQRSHIQESLLDRLPNHLKEEVLLEMNKQFISSIQIFKGFSPQCLKMISLSIKQKQLLPDQIAIQEKEYNDSLYFISQGTLQILCSVSQKQDETMFEKGITMLKKQDSFGYEGFLYGENCPYSIKSVQQSVISYLEKEQFLQIIKHFPTDYEKFCYIRDKQIYDSFQKVVYRLKCISCQEQDHYPNHCQFINPTIKYKNDKSVNMRSFCHRIKTRNTNILKNNKYYQDIAITLAYMRDDTLTAQQDTINDNSSNDQSYISDDLQSGDKLNQIIKRNNGQEASRKSKDILQVDFVLEDNANLKPKSLNELNTKNQQFIVLNINSNENNNNINKNDQDMDSNQIQKQASSASFTQSIKSLALSDLSDMNKAKSREDNLSDKGKQQESDKAAFNNNHHDFQLFQNNNLSVNIDDNISSKQINSGQQNATKIENAKQKLSKKVNQKFSKSLFSQQLSNNLEPQIEENLNVNQETENNKIITIKQKSLNIIDLKQEDSQTFRKRSNSEIQQENISISKFLKPQPKAQKAKVSDKGKNQTFSNINSLIQSANLINKRAHILNENKIKYQLSQPKEIEDNQLDSNEFQIRFMLNLQNLDMLVVRKEYLLMQQKNQITDYIQVPDNEIDIDVLHNYKYYYFNGNFKQVLQRMKTRDDKNKDVLSSPHKKKSNGSRKNQRKTHRYKPTSFNSKKNPS